MWRAINPTIASSESSVPVGSASNHTRSTIPAAMPMTTVSRYHHARGATMPGIALSLVRLVLGIFGFLRGRVLDFVWTVGRRLRAGRVVGRRLLLEHRCRVGRTRTARAAVI